MTELVLVDDHQSFVDGMKALVSTTSDLRVVGEASDAPQAYETVERLAPDLVVVDLGLPQVDGVAIVRELVRRDRSRPVMVLTSHGDRSRVMEALGAGARGYALKLQPGQEILAAMRTVAGGRTYLAPHVSHFVVEDHVRVRRGEPVPSGPLDALSPREREIFHLLAAGHTNDNIAANLSISVKTVETHRAHVLKKLKLHSLVDLVRFAARNELLPP